jgi:hypothetical protein
VNLIPFPYFTIPLLGIALVVGALAVAVRDRTPEQRVRLLARVVYWAVWGSAALVTFVSGKEIARSLWSASVPVSIEVSPFWPVTPPEVSATPGPAVVDVTGTGDGFSSATVHLIGLSGGTRALLALDQAAVLIAVVALCVLVARLARGVLQGSVFGVVKAREFVIAGGVFVVTAMTALIANALAHSAILTEAMPRQISFDTRHWTGTAIDGHSDVFGVVSWSWSLDAPTWIWVAAALSFVIGLVIRRGNQLEVDTEGLI